MYSCDVFGFDVVDLVGYELMLLGVIDCFWIGLGLRYETCYVLGGIICSFGCAK